jgi:hypothetical protein
MEMNAILDAQPLVEVSQVCAAAQEDVLAVVDGRTVVITLSCGVLVQRIGRSSAA